MHLDRKESGGGTIVSFAEFEGKNNVGLQVLDWLKVGAMDDGSDSSNGARRFGL